jgi:hypothetical protein
LTIKIIKGLDSQQMVDPTPFSRERGVASLRKEVNNITHKKAIRKPSKLQVKAKAKPKGKQVAKQKAVKLNIWAAIVSIIASLLALLLGLLK